MGDELLDVSLDVGEGGILEGSDDLFLHFVVVLFQSSHFVEHQVLYGYELLGEQGVLLLFLCLLVFLHEGDHFYDLAFEESGLEDLFLLDLFDHVGLVRGWRGTALLGTLLLFQLFYLLLLSLYQLSVLLFLLSLHFFPLFQLLQLLLVLHDLTILPFLLTPGAVGGTHLVWSLGAVVTHCLFSHVGSRLRLGVLLGHVALLPLSLDEQLDLVFDLLEFVLLLLEYLLGAVLPLDLSALLAMLLLMFQLSILFLLPGLVQLLPLLHALLEPPLEPSQRAILSRVVVDDRLPLALRRREAVGRSVALLDCRVIIHEDPLLLIGTLETHVLSRGVTVDIVPYQGGECLLVLAETVQEPVDLRVESLLFLFLESVLLFCQESVVLGVLVDAHCPYSQQQYKELELHIVFIIFQIHLWPNWCKAFRVFLFNWYIPF